MSEDFETITCVSCGVEVETRHARDVDTPVGPASVCVACAIYQVTSEPIRDEGSHD